MKKDRPAWLLSVICRPEDGERFAKLFFEETTTLGVRIGQTPRWKLARTIMTVETPWGKARVKVGMLGERAVTFSPEFEDLRELAQKSGRPLKEVRRVVLQKFGEENQG
jgi:pyridinium-3,5-bisthiocarboxylic acid mononucleotide nickel chelatase